MLGQLYSKITKYILGLNLCMRIYLRNIYLDLIRYVFQFVFVCLIEQNKNVVYKIHLHLHLFSVIIGCRQRIFRDCAQGPMERQLCGCQIF